MQSPKILIVGSGPAGLTLALSLLKNGVPVRIIEKDTQYHRGTRGTGITPRTLEIEHFLRLRDEVCEKGAPPPTIHIFDPNDPYHIIQTAKMMAEIEPTPAFPITRAVLLGQWHHQAILRRHIEALGGKVELGSTFIGCTQDENSVTAEIHKTINGVEQTENARFEYLVGADGGRSVVRKSIGVNFFGETREEGRIHLVDARIEGLSVDTDLRVLGSQNTAMVTLWQTAQPGLFQIMFAGPEARFDFLKEHGDTQAVEEELHRITNRTDLRVSEVTWQSEWKPNIRMVDHFQVGRVFIVGDAAHTHSPTGGQGMNSSVQDAFNLAWKLALSIKGAASPRLLESFESERLPVIAEMLKLTTALLDRFVQYGIDTEDSVGEANETQAQKNSQDEKVWVRDAKLSQLDIHYRWSPVVFDERFPHPTAVSMSAYSAMTSERRAGDRAPDAPSLIGANGPDRLFDMFNPAMHTVLLFVANQSLIEQARAIITPLSSIDTSSIQKVLVLPAGTDASDVLMNDIEYAVVDSKGHAFTNYGVDPSESSPKAVIVRPDAMIGAFLKTEADTRKYLSLVFR